MKGMWSLWVPLIVILVLACWIACRVQRRGKRMHDAGSLSCPRCEQVHREIAQRREQPGVLARLRARTGNR